MIGRKSTGGSRPEAAGTRTRSGWRTVLVLAAFVSLSTARGLEIAGYDPAVNNRFSEGFDTANPTANPDAAFVGQGYDWSGIGWNQSPGGLGRVQNFAMLSPVDAFSAWHYSLSEPYAWDSERTEVQFQNRAGGVVSASIFPVGTTPDLPGFAYGQDLRITKLTRPLTAAAQVSPLRVLDISSGHYFQQSVFVMGSNMEGVTDFSTGPLIATAKVSLRYQGVVAVSGHSSDSSLSYQSSSGGDSGSPLLLPYKGELTLMGSTWFANGTAGSLLPIPDWSYDPTTGINTIMAENGYAIKWTIYDAPADAANTANRWQGAAGSGAFGAAANWSLGVVPENRPVVFDSGTANGQTTVALDGDRNLRGLLFVAGEEPGGFSFSSPGTLTLGASGIRNEHAQTQSFQHAISLASSQNWEAAAGDLHFGGAITNNGFLLAVGGSGDVTFSGNLSGLGGLAKDGSGTLTLLAASSYTGRTFLHDGTLRLGVDNALFVRTAVIFDTANPHTTFDINSRRITIGSLRSEVASGATGIVTLAGGSLTVGGSHASTTYAGVFAGHGSLTKTGIGTWTLTGTSSDFGGSLAVQRGAVVLDGVLGGGSQTVSVVSGTGTRLGGGGTLVGDLTLRDGSAVSLVDSGFGIFTITEGIVWDGGAAIRMELGGDGRSDLIDLAAGVLHKGSAGTYEFQFSLTGEIAAGDQFVLMTFGATDFTAGDFRFTGLEDLPGRFLLSGDRLELLIVPEPSPANLGLASALAVLAFRWGRSRRRLHLNGSRTPTGLPSFPG